MPNSLSYFLIFWHAGIRKNMGLEEHKKAKVQKLKLDRTKTNTNVTSFAIFSSKTLKNISCGVCIDKFSRIITKVIYKWF